MAGKRANTYKPKKRPKDPNAKVTLTLTKAEREVPLLCFRAEGRKTGRG